MEPTNPVPNNPPNQNSGTGPVAPVPQAPLPGTVSQPPQPEPQQPVVAAPAPPVVAPESASFQPSAELVEPTVNAAQPGQPSLPTAPVPAAPLPGSPNPALDNAVTASAPQAPQFFQPSAPQQPVISAAQPVIGTVGENQMGQPFVAAKPTKLPLMIGGGIVGVLLLIFVGIFAVGALAKPITLADIQKAETLSSGVSGSLSAASSALDQENSSTTLTDINSNATTVASKVSAANSQYAQLKKSVVLRDSTVKQKFAAVDKKWAAFTAYLNNDANDLKLLGAPILSLANTLTTINTAASPQNTAEVSTYLKQIKTSIDTSTQQTASLTLKIDTNQKVLAAWRTYLDGASQAVQKAQSDLANGQDLYTVQSDLGAMDSSQMAFDNASTTIQNQNNAEQKQLDVADQFNAFLSALGSLASKTKN